MKRYGVIVFIEIKDLSIEIDDLYEEMSDQLGWFGYENRDKVNIIIGESIELRDDQIIPEDLLGAQPVPVPVSVSVSVPDTCQQKTLQDKFSTLDGLVQDLKDTVRLMSDR